MNGPNISGLDATSAALRAVTRRQFFSRCGVGVGTLALASLLRSQSAGAGAAAAGLPQSGHDRTGAMPPHAPPRARSVIYLFWPGVPPSWSCSITSRES